MALIRPITDDLDQEDVSLLERVGKYGHMVLHIPEDEVGPGFSFSVGLTHTHGHAELLLFGLDWEVAHSYVNFLAEKIAGGRRYVDGEEVPELFGRYAGAFVAVPRSQYPEYLGTARWAYRSDDFETLQVVYPDREGRWPWEDGVHDGFLARQPVLGRWSPGH